MKTIKIVYQIDVDGRYCNDFLLRKGCLEYNGGWCKKFRTNTLLFKGIPLRCQDCLDAEKEYNKLKDTP